MPWASKVHRSVVKASVQKSLSRRQVSRSLRGYTKEWMDASRMYLAENQLCVECVKEGKRKPSKVTDHIRPHRGDMVLFWDRSNWQALCVMHHGRKTATEDGGFGNATKT
jgi:5-methylcytosine-specific restriction protein A